MKIRTSRWRLWRTISIWVVGVAILAVGGFLTYHYAVRDISALPSSIKTELTFSPFVLPNSTKNATATDYKFSTAEDKVQILSFVAHLKSGTISVSEYPQPPEFAEIPEYKDRFLSNVINQYATVETSNGTIYLGHAPRQNNRQLGIMMERGLLVLMNPDKELTSAQWRSFGDQLQIQRITN